MHVQRVGSMLVSLGLGACLGNQSGNVAASKLGDTSLPAERGSPLQTLRDACGEGAPTAAGASVIQRQPYLQQVTSTSAQVGWITTAPTGQHVGVAAVAAAERTVLAEREATTLRSVGEAQMWTQLDRLEPGTVYCYDIGDAAQKLVDRTGFRTAPSADSAEPVRFLAFGDSGGGGSDQYALLDQMYEFPYELMIHVGDLAYDSGTLEQIEDTVFSVYADLFRNVPFFPVPGNHDYKTAGGAPYREAFSLPGTSGERWYSYDWGRIHFVALDTETSEPGQWEWLESDLARTTLPWKVVYLHRPLYSSGSHGSDTGLRARLAPIFEKHRVQVVFAGHDHHYERTTPQNGVTYVVTGGGGVGTRPPGSSSFTALSDGVIHFVYGEATEDELTLHAVDATGQEFDAVVIPR